MDVNDDVKWYKGTLELLKKHQFYTESQKKLRGKGKQKNIKNLIKKIQYLERKLEAKYNPIFLFQQPQL